MQKSGSWNQLPIVAVIIPCHQHAQYIKCAFDSVVKQDYANKVMVFVDDGSDDGAFDIAAGYLSDVQKVDNEFYNGVYTSSDGLSINTYISKNENPTGPSAARNKAIKFAWNFAHLFNMLDCDDELLPEKLSRSVIPFLEHPQYIGLVYTDSLIYNEHYGVYIPEYREPYNDTRHEMECICSNTPMISKMALETCGLYDHSFRCAQDWLLYLKITARFLAVHLPFFGSIYRVTGKNASDIVNMDVWKHDWARIGQYIQKERRVAK